MREETLRLGADGRLLAIAATPDDLQPSLPIVLLFNAGLIHRVGPHRLNVTMARRLADDGWTSVRFDLSGIGDSERPHEERPYVDQVIADATEAMDDLEQRFGTRDFVLAGLCTGAYNALAVAANDPRVVGTALIDGYAYPTLRYSVTNKARKAVEGWRWKRYIKRRLGLGPAPTDSPPDDVMVFAPELLDRQEFGERVQTLTGRGVEIHFTYTGLGPQPYNYANQLRDAFPEFDESKTIVKYMPKSHHTFVIGEHRGELVDSIATWLGERFRDRATLDNRSTG